MFNVAAFLLTLFQNLSCGVLYLDMGIANACFFLVLYDIPLSICFCMKGMLRDVCHLLVRKDSVARASVFDVVALTMMGGYLCDDLGLFQNLIAGSQCTNWSLLVCFCFLFLLRSLFSMSCVVMPTYVCCVVRLILR